MTHRDINAYTSNARTKIQGIVTTEVFRLNNRVNTITQVKLVSGAMADTRQGIVARAAMQSHITDIKLKINEQAKKTMKGPKLIMVKVKLLMNLS